MPEVTVHRLEKGALDEGKDKPRRWTAWRVFAPLVLLVRRLKKLARAIRTLASGA